jgi:hypothetical protein
MLVYRAGDPALIDELIGFLTTGKSGALLTSDCSAWKSTSSAAAT